MAQQMSRTLAAIRSSAIDRRVHNAFFRQDQLKSLHQCLVKNTSSIQRWMGEDEALTPADVAIEYCLTIRCVVEAYEGIDPVRALADEYAVTKGLDQLDMRRPVGIVIIEPYTQAFVHSTIAALAVALAAGNCVIIQIATPTKPQQLFLEILSQALDSSIFTVTNEPGTAAELKHPHVRVVQNGTSTVEPQADCLVSATQAPVIAFVERDAHIEEAAKLLVFARFARGGVSPYAPDVVLVNEWVKKPFLEAVVREQTAHSEGSDKKRKRNPDLSKDIQRGNSSLVSSQQNGEVVDVHDRRSSLLGSKHRAPCLVVHAVKSVDDAINVAKVRIGPSAAAYVFAPPPAAKYFCQFVDSSVSYINHLPIKLLYGPSSPKMWAPHAIAGDIYVEEMFTVREPRLVSVSNLNQQLRRVIEHHDTTNNSMDRILAEASAPLREQKRPDHVSPVGFFEQGIITGLVLALTTIVGGLGVSAYLVRRYLSAQ